MSQSRRSETFVYYFPECVLVVKTRGFKASVSLMSRDWSFSFASHQVTAELIHLSGVQWRERNGLPELV